MQHLHAGHLLEQHGAQVVRGAGAGAGIGQLAGVGACVGDQLLDVVRGHRRVDHHGVGHIGQQAQRGEVFHAAKGHVGHQRGVHRVGAHGAYQQGVAVGPGARDHGGADIAGCAGLVVDDHRLAEGAGQVLGQHTRQDVGGAAGGPRHDQRDGLLREGVGRAGARGSGKQRERGKAKQAALQNGFHLFPSPIAMRTARCDPV